MFKKSAIAALAVVVASTAFTASASDQLARSLGVEPGVYSTSELVKLKSVLENNERTYQRFLSKKVDAATRGVPFASSNNETAAKAYAIANVADDDNKHTIEHYERVLNGAYPVSAETIAFTQAHLATNIEDEN